MQCIVLQYSAVHHSFRRYINVKGGVSEGVDFVKGGGLAREESVTNVAIPSTL